MERWERGERVIDALVAEEYEKLFDPDFQVVFGYFPPEGQIRARFSSDNKFRLWRHRTLKRYLPWVTRAPYSDSDKLLISGGLYHALGEQPDTKWAKKRKKRRK
jgi:hypothetical protein